MESKVHKESCEECFGNETVAVYFVNHSKKLIIEEWEYCKTCFPTSHCYEFDKCCYEPGVEEIETEEAHTLIEKEGYKKHVP